MAAQHGLLLAALALLLAVGAAATTAEPALVGTAFFFEKLGDQGACGFPSGAPSWAGQAALSPNSTLAVQVSV